MAAAATSPAVPYLLDPVFYAPPQTPLNHVSIDDINVSEFSAKLRNVSKRPEDLFTPSQDLGKYLERVYRNLNDSRVNHAIFLQLNTVVQQTRRLLAPLYERSQSAWLDLLANDESMLQCMTLLQTAPAVFLELEKVAQETWKSDARDSHPVSMWVRWMGAFCNETQQFLARRSTPNDWSGGLGWHAWGLPRPDFITKLVTCGRETRAHVRRKRRVKQFIRHPYNALTNDADRQAYTQDQARADTLLNSITFDAQSTVVQGHAYLSLLEFGLNLAHNLQTLLTLVWARQSIVYLSLTADEASRLRWVSEFYPVRNNEDSDDDVAVDSSSLIWTGDNSKDESLPGAYGKPHQAWQRLTPDRAEVRMLVPTPNQWHPRRLQHTAFLDTVAYAGAIIGQPTTIAPAPLLVEALTMWPDQRRYFSAIVYACVANAIINDAYSRDDVVNRNQELEQVLGRSYLKGRVVEDGNVHALLRTNPQIGSGSQSAFRPVEMPLPSTVKSGVDLDKAAFDAANILVNHKSALKGPVKRLVQDYFVVPGNLTKITDVGMKWYLLWQQTMLCARAVCDEIETSVVPIETQDNVHLRAGACKDFMVQMLDSLSTRDSTLTLVEQVGLEYEKHLYGFVINRAPQRNSLDGTWTIDDAFADWDKFLDAAYKKNLYRPSVRSIDEPQILAAQHTFQLAKEVTAGCLATLQLLEVILSAVIESQADGVAVVARPPTERFLPDIGPDTSDFMARDMAELYNYLAFVNIKHGGGGGNGDATKDKYARWRVRDQPMPNQPFHALRFCVQTLHDQFLYRGQGIPATTSATQKLIQLGPKGGYRSIFRDAAVFPATYASEMEAMYEDQAKFSRLMLELQDSLQRLHDERNRALDAAEHQLHALRPGLNIDQIQMRQRIIAQRPLMVQQQKALREMKEALERVDYNLFEQPRDWRYFYDAKLTEYLARHDDYHTLLEDNYTTVRTIVEQGNRSWLVGGDLTGLLEQRIVLGRQLEIYGRHKSKDDLVARPRWMLNLPRNTNFTELSREIVDRAVQGYMLDVDTAFNGGDYARQLVAAAAYPVIALQKDKLSQWTTTTAFYNALTTMLIVAQHAALFAPVATGLVQIWTGEAPASWQALVFLIDKAFAGGRYFQTDRSATDAVVAAAKGAPRYNTDGKLNAAHYAVTQDESRFRQLIRDELGATADTQRTYDVNGRIFRVCAAAQASKNFASIKDIIERPGDWIRDLPTALDITGPNVSWWSRLSGMVKIVDLINTGYVGVHSIYVLQRYGHLMTWHEWYLENEKPDDGSPPAALEEYDRKLQRHASELMASATGVRSLVWNVYFARVTTLGIYALAHSIKNTRLQARAAMGALFETIFRAGWVFEFGTLLLSPGIVPLADITIRPLYNQIAPSTYQIDPITPRILQYIARSIPAKLYLIPVVLHAAHAMLQVTADKLNEHLISVPFARTVIDATFGSLNFVIGKVIDKVDPIRLIADFLTRTVTNNLPTFIALSPVGGLVASLVQIVVVATVSIGLVALYKWIDTKISHADPHWHWLSIPTSAAAHFIAHVLAASVVPNLQTLPL